MPRTGYDNCIRVMKAVFENRMQNEIPASSIEALIRKQVGTDDRTVQKYKKDLVRLGFLEQVNANTYRVRADPVPYEGYREELASVAGQFQYVVGSPLPNEE